MPRWLKSKDSLRRRGEKDISTALWDRAFLINTRSCFLATKYALPHLLARGHGALVHIASGAGLAGDIGLTAYGASKAAVVNFSRSVAAQYGRQGVRSNAVCPGLIAQDPMPAELAPLYRAGLAGAYATRNGRPQDIAAMVAYLGADEAGFVNGGTFTCDGAHVSVMPPWRPHLAGEEVGAIGGSTSSLSPASCR